MWEAEGMEGWREGEGREKQDAGRQEGRREVKAEGGMRNVRPGREKKMK